MVVLESGADDYEDADDEWIVYTDYQDLAAVKKALEDAGIELKGSELIMVPTTYTQVDAKDAPKVMRLIDRLEELEDLQSVYHTMEMTDEVVAALED
jgi:transcriptional/translational regulatory protein YebC/TACO1